MTHKTFRRNRTNQRRSRAAAVITGVGAAAVMAVLSAPTAGATVTSITIDPGFSTGSSNVYGMGCSYNVTATLDDPGPVFFGSTGLANFDPTWVNPANGRAQSRWTPRATGLYWVTASTGEGDGETFKNVQVRVSNAIALGPICLVIP
ncbi:hypothetical protein [Antrihabitans sp. YC2-6]|uniref:hypothetical protein n=1 Tax=Antrihabitans sp. YC2-6 TaxID=2799498 RepID=UPI0018F35876|nr:hypothetical protein [Antrihabitans sp. YC2-6]MBJ8347777.1 hypothetical protein [Antrihabitans sp. YC2-6]